MIDGDFSESNEIVNEHCMIQGEYRATYAEVQHVAVSLQRCCETLHCLLFRVFSHGCGQRIVSIVFQPFTQSASWLESGGT